MAAGWWVLLCVGVLSLTKQGHGQLHQINLTGENIQCNMSSTYSNDKYGTSGGCHAAINGNTGTIWIPINQTNPPNCIYTDYGDLTPSWIVNLGQGHNIHKIQIYFDESYLKYVINATISVDGVNIFTFPSSESSISNPHPIVSQHMPVRGQVIAIRRTDYYVTLCEFQAYECAMNKHGPDCGKSCIQHCVSQQGQTSCDSITGNCIQGCQTGWWGAQCNTQCPVQCDGPCDREMGHCSTCMGNFVPPTCTGCKDGWWDAQCNHRCPLHCNEPCDRNTGRCQNCSNHFAPPNCTICHAGWYGALCDQECSVNCEPDNGVITCHQIDGTCTSGCKVGWHGNYCDKECSRYCLPDEPANVTRCRQNNGECVTGCKTGWWDAQCNQQCPHQCDGPCSRETGQCPNCNKHFAPPKCTVCQVGWYGDLCEQECSEKCGSDNGNITCRQSDGMCTSGCKAGWHGNHCDIECSQYCLPDGQSASVIRCNQSNGECVIGCVTGWYKPDCTVPCSVNCDGGCDRNDGACHLSSKQETSEGSSLVGPLVGSVLGAGLLIGGSILLTGLLRRRRSQDASSPGRPEKRNTGICFMVENVPTERLAKGDTAGEDPDANYAHLEKYENPDDIKPYSSLQSSEERVVVDMNKMAAQYENVAGPRTC